MAIDPAAALKHAKKCRAIARCINQAFTSWLSGHNGFRDLENFSSIRELLDDTPHPPELVIWQLAFSALRREFAAIEPLLNQLGGWLDGVPFERWLGGKGLSLTIYHACSWAIIEEETEDNYDEEACHARVAAAADEMFHGGNHTDFRRFTMKAGVEISRQCDEFYRAVDAVIREMERQLSTVTIGANPKATVNARMIDTLQHHVAARDWTVRQWAEKLSCASSTVGKQPTWKELQRQRCAAKLDRQQ